MDKTAIQGEAWHGQVPDFLAPAPTSARVAVLTSRPSSSWPITQVQSVTLVFGALEKILEGFKHGLTAILVRLTVNELG
jgi:hypothetical protein